MIKYHLKSCLLCMILLACHAAVAVAADTNSALRSDLRLEAPQRAARGDAFVARTISTAPGDTVFRWRGKEHVVPARQSQLGQGQRGQGQLGQGQFVAEILLAVPVDDEKNSSLTLEARSAKAKAAATVRVYSKDRPVQKLTVERKYVNPPQQEMPRIKADREKVRAATSVFSAEKHWDLPMLRPVPGSVSSLFGLKRVFNGEPRSVHKGLDLRGAEGTPIAAAADGVVVLADNLYYSGNAVYLDHGLGVFSAYLHMSKSHVRPGQRVRRGEVIGLVGATGRVTGPHLHLTMLVQGVPVDPQPLMKSTAEAQQ